jgi:VWFA-related protein
MIVRHISTVVVLIGVLAMPASDVASGFGRTNVGSGFSRTNSQQRTNVTEGVRAVLVDVVIRDRRGQLVRDLTQADFEVVEDGTPQKLGSFTPMFDAAPAAAATAAARPAANTPSPSTGGTTAPASDNNRPVITALVFDRLSPESQRLAVQAAQSYLGNKEQTQTYVGIFGVDQALAPYAPFTRNAVQLRQALGKVANRSNSSYNSNQQQKAAADQTAAAASRAVASAAATAGPGTSNAMGSAGATAQLAQMESQMISDFAAMERDQQGYSLTNGLFAIIGALGRMPGRKSMILFSEGVAIPPAVQRLFRGVIDAANRANVSIYTMDAVGLRAVSPQAEIRDKVNEAAGFGINTAYSGTGVSEPLTKGLETNEDVLTQDPHNGLGQLSQETGGLIFDNTNNLRQGFDRVEEDLHNYYLLGYTPSNDNYDGKFRKIEIKVNRPGVVISARKGYFAVRNPGFAPVNAWEAPALGALEQKPLPNGFPVRAGALSFPERGRPGLTPVLVEFQTAPLTFQPSADGKNYSSDFAVIVRFLDDQNQVARKVSQHYEINGPAANLENAKKGEVIFYREPELAPGVYTMETIVYDTPSGKSSVRLSTVQVPRLDEAKLRVSTLLLVKRGEKVPEKDRRAANPLMVKDLLLYPNLGEAVSKAAKEVSFYFTVYPAQGGSAPEAAFELLQNGQRVLQVPMPLSGADASGRIQQTGRLPIDQIPPGTYELRAIVKQGSDQITRTTMLRLSD